ncbi:MAG: hypothetical protein ACLTKI_00190 [Lachnospiraceae bacterium]
MKRMALCLAAVLFCLARPVVAQAEEDEVKKINRISLEIESDLAYTEDITITEKTEGYLVSGYEILNSTDGEWHATQCARVRIYLEAEDGYEFKRKGESYFGLSGKTVFRYADSSYKGRQELWLYVDLKPIDGNVGTAMGLRWTDGGIAHWDSGFRAKTYEVALIENGRRRRAESQSSLSKDFREQMKEGNTYAFSVSAVNAEGERSEKVVSSEFVYTGAKGAVSPIGWVENPKGWKYVTDTAGTQWCTNQWQQINGIWYRFNEEGYMLTGWYQEPDSGIWYYLDENGAMYADCVTPDGYRVGPDGSWIP